MSSEIGIRVQQVRAEANLNQREFAARLGISSGGISQVESGKTMPGGDFLLRIHQEFGVDVTWLLTGMSKPSISESVAPVLTARQVALLDNYQHTDERGKKIIEAAALAAAEPNSSKRNKAA